MLAAQRLEENPCRPRHFRPPPPCAPVVADERAAAQLETSRSRLVMAAALFAVVFLVVVLRLADVVLLAPSGESHAGPRGPHIPVAAPTPMQRADIVDRNGRLLATTLDSPSLYADPRLIASPDEAAHAILTVFPELDAAELKAKLGAIKSFVWLRRRLTPKQQWQVNRLGIPGLNFEHEVRRIYPYGDLAAHVVGFCGIDNNGLAGIERALDSTVKSSHEPVQLSLDARVQFILHEELAKVMADFTAKGAAGIIMDVHTGEIIAMVSLPDFDPNHPGRADTKLTPQEEKDRVFNKITLGSYELGSVFKTFNTAMALDGGTATMTKSYDAAHNIEIGRFTISDYHGKHRALSVPEIYMYSSNIGSARMALEAGADRQRSFLSKLGLLKPVPIEFDEVGKPHFPSHWGEVNTITIAYGHGISVTPLHAVTAVSAVVNGGILRPPTFRKLAPNEVPQGERVMAPKTSEQMRKLMRLVVEYGTAKLANAPGYVVGGKTGTAEKNVGGHYVEKKLLSDFVGAFPINDPKYAFLLLVDEPHPNKDSHGYATAGWTVVPATSRLIQRIAPLLGVQPVDEASPAVTRALQIESLQGKKFEDY